MASPDLAVSDQMARSPARSARRVPEAQILSAPRRTSPLVFAGTIVAGLSTPPRHGSRLAPLSSPRYGARRGDHNYTTSPDAAARRAGLFHTAQLEKDGKLFRYVFDCGAVSTYKAARSARIERVPQGRRFKRAVVLPMFWLPSGSLHSRKPHMVRPMLYRPSSRALRLFSGCPDGQTLLNCLSKAIRGVRLL